VEEIVTVDDGSTDRTREVVASFNDARITTITQDNRGLAAARNRGIAEATHSLIAFLDADDEWFPERIEKQLPFASAGRFISSDALFWDERSGKDIGTYALFDRFPRDQRKFIGNVLQGLLAQNFIHPSTVLINRKDLLDHGGFNESLPVAEDWDMWLRLAEDMHHERVDFPLARVRRRPDSLQADSVRLTEFSTRVLDEAAHRLRLGGRLDDRLRASLGLGYFGSRATSKARHELFMAAIRRPWRFSRWYWAGASLVHPFRR
jgi:glycosyltransferase involved in cell wall biosynthesis